MPSSTFPAVSPTDILSSNISHVSFEKRYNNCLPLLLFCVQGSLFYSLTLTVRELKQQRRIYILVAGFFVLENKGWPTLLSMVGLSSQTVSTWYLKWASPALYLLSLCLALVNAVQIIKLTWLIERCIWSLWSDFSHLQIT